MTTGREKVARDYLTGSIRLSRHEDGSSPEDYKVGRVIGEGGSVVCYEATRTLSDGTVESGRLKEFYPVDTFAGNSIQYVSMRRLPDGQLVPGAGTVRKFAEMSRSYVESYKILYKVMADSPDNEILKSYIQHGEILYGVLNGSDDTEMAGGSRRESIHSTVGKHDAENITPDRMTTVYIWSSGFAGEGFDQWIGSVRQNPKEKPERTLQTILTIFASMTDFARALHTAGLMHLDIKPSNFMVQYDSNRQIRPDSISVFDINSMRTCDSSDNRMPWSDGFSAPELQQGRADNRSDIYSIGAMLFNALVIIDDIPDGRYHDYYYPSLSGFLRNSSLFTASETNSDARLLSKLCTILEKCLAKDPDDRYSSCTDLLNDIRTAQKRMARLLNAPLPKNERGLTDPTIVIRKLLYEHPLYEALSHGAQNIRVLVIGAGNYGQRFIDLALQAGQMTGFRLSITAASDEPERDREDYLKFRPAMTDFVNVNGSSKKDGKETYADLNFIPIAGMDDSADNEAHFGRDSEVNEKLLLSLLCGNEDRESSYDYIFVSLGDSDVSRTIASLCADLVANPKSPSCPVCYVTRKRKKATKEELAAHLYPVNINESVDLAKIADGLGEMAFNAHISWQGNMNIDITQVREKFFSDTDVKWRYNRNSSLSYVLSVPYKLYSAFIQYEDLTAFALRNADHPDESARIFQKRILDRKTTDPKAEKLFAELTDLEHRRWLLQMAADGWTAPRREDGSLDLESCIARGSVRDDSNRTHPCMVHGSTASPLSSEAYQEDHHQKWDEGEIDPNLDELDRMSIDLHRCFSRRTEQLRTKNLSDDPDLRVIEDMIPENNEAVRKAFVQFRYALKNILAGEESYCRQYGDYSRALEEAVSGLPEAAVGEIKKRLKIIRDTYFPAIERGMYRNYKANDEVLVRKIPFILAFRYVPSLALAFQDGRFENGRNEAVFPDVASATILGPERIHYLYCFDGRSDETLFIRKLDSVLHYLMGREVQCSVEIAVAILAEVPASVRKSLTKDFDVLLGKYTKHVVLKPLILRDAEDYPAAADVFERYLLSNPVSLYDAGVSLFPSVMDQGDFIARLRDNGIPCFELDWRSKRFLRHDRCEYLQYLEDDSYIRIKDMFDLMNVRNSRYSIPEYAEDYKKLWAIYTGSYVTTNTPLKDGVSNWNYLCAALEEYEKNRAPFAKIKMNSSSFPETREVLFYLPSYTGAVARTLFQKLEESGIALTGSMLDSYSESMLRMRLSVAKENVEECKKIFSEPKYLLPYYHMNVEVVHDTASDEDYAEIRYFDEHVSNAGLAKEPKDEWKSRYELELLNRLQHDHFIKNLALESTAPYRVSFDYTTPEVKKLLTKGGEILEIYTYYEVLKTGFFDDVKTGYEFEWEEGGVRNELDLVLTKGFRTMIVECKAVQTLELDYYHKLHSIATQFGIGTISVLVGNTYLEGLKKNSSNTGKNSKISKTVEINDMQRSRGRQLSIQTVYGEERITNIGKELVRIMKKEMKG